MSAPRGGPRRRRSADALERRLSNVVDVDDGRRVLECSQVERQLCFQHLVRHYLSQMLHGCQSAYCDTPTCLSSQKRSASRPVRPPTQLTARALAHYLACQGDAHRGLCPHELKVTPISLQIEGAIGACLQQGKHGDRQYSVYPSAWRSGHMSRKSRSLESARAQHDMSRGQQHVVDALKKRRQTRKDTKSLSQNLFDSVTMIFAYSKQLPSSASMLDTLRSSNSSKEDRSIALLDALAAESQTRLENLPRQHITTVASANGDTAAPHVNRTACIDRQHSQTHLRAQCHAHASPTSPELLSNGQQVHKIPYHLRDPTSPSKPPKSASQTLFDGTHDSPRLSIMKTGKKSFTLGRTAPEMEQNSYQPAAPGKTGNVSQFNPRPDPALPVLSDLNCNTLEQLKNDVYDHRKDQLPDEFNFAVDYDTNRHFQLSKPFVNRSLFYTFSDAETLLTSFRDSNRAFACSPLPHLDSAWLMHSFRDWNRRNGALIFDSLWIALEALYVPPPELVGQKSPRLRPSRKGATADTSAEQTSNEEATAKKTHRYLSNPEAAHIVMICIHALTSSVSVGWPHTWAQLRKLRAWGIIIPNAAPDTNDFTHPYLNIIDELEYEPAMRLADRLLCAIGARTCLEHIQAALKKQERHIEDQDDEPKTTLVEIVVQHLAVVERVALVSRRRLTPNSSVKVGDDPGWTVTATLVEWLKTIITKKWDSKPDINKWSGVGTAVMLLDKLCISCDLLNLREHMFEIPFFNERLEAVEEPLRFLSWEEQPNTLHILQYPGLFPMEYLVRYFRTINFTSMMAQYDHTTRMRQMKRSLDMFLREPHRWLIKSHMQVTLSEYLILNISREQPLRDTLDQLWGLEKRMLLKPLKVNMGQHEGEVGADHGGVTYEFFRVVLSEAFKPDHGMFIIDPKTQMTWFQPSTLEPDWKFEMIGMLFSLAVYNGITLPVTFPLALYRFLLPLAAPLRDRGMNENTVEFIRDGWPDLAKGLEQLLAWTDGNVQDVFMRDYAFSYQAFGQRIDHNMEEPYVRPKHSTPISLAVRPEDILNFRTKEAKLVTSENREHFVRDYIHHLTYLSIHPQIYAFQKGFLACLQSQSLHFFSPQRLRSLVEGEQHISIPELRRCARYEEGYSTTHPTVRNFWHIVENYSQEDRRHLLEFVTASDRVPVTGYKGITFHIVRIGDAEMLPTSSTCFGKLYLPEYQDEETLRIKLELAIKNSKGFGII